MEALAGSIHGKHLLRLWTALSPFFKVSLMPGALPAYQSFPDWLVLPVPCLGNRFLPQVGTILS